MPVTFDMTRLEALSGRVQQLMTPDFKTEIAQVLSVTALGLIQDGFRYSRDPYGDTWAPLKDRNGQPLRDTGRLQNSPHVTRIASDGFVVTFGANYATYHQTGTRPNVGQRAAARASGRWVGARGRGAAYSTRGGIPRRMMVPTETRGMSPIWAARFTRDVKSLVRRRPRVA
jgi:phage gpG-like protein